jgi:uncharacterized membrane protein YqjE
MLEPATPTNQFSTADSAPKTKRPSLKALLFVIVVNAFTAGMLFGFGILDVRRPGNEYKWVYDFATAAAFLVLTLVSGLRLRDSRKTSN